MLRLSSERLIAAASAGASAARDRVLSLGSPCAAAEPLPWSRGGSSPEACAAASDAVLRSVVRVPFTSGLRAGLYTVEAGNVDAPPLVLLHGFAMGSAMWCLTLDALAARYRVFAVDMRGCGASPRPAWPVAAAGAPGGRLAVAATERWFIDSLEDWRTEVGLDAFALLGHSLGGYLAGAYSLAAPRRVRHLLLASPAGVAPPPPEHALRAPRRPFSFLQDMIAWSWDRRARGRRI